MSLHSLRVAGLVGEFDDERVCAAGEVIPVEDETARGD